ncbi:hypothetical protein GCM10018793_70210 [Streptomyces sulfonofaciens]|uniref:Uncharacterized protein n=1 Tax=Streptomyces sulfonofaciens TaxID=68272 RepID=A0A919LD14_9ACTN|nr:hypothetical protein GCM10018793_70210 [Streptomyces sulfonofaciens]
MLAVPGGDERALSGGRRPVHRPVAHRPAGPHGASYWCSCKAARGEEHPVSVQRCPHSGDHGAHLRTAGTAQRPPFDATCLAPEPGPPPAGRGAALDAPLHPAQAE